MSAALTEAAPGFSQGFQADKLAGFHAPVFRPR